MTCPRPPSIANGLHSAHSSGSFSRGLTVSYSCKEGFELLGNVSITCTDSGLWSRPLPRCEGVWVPHACCGGAGRVLGVLWGQSRRGDGSEERGREGAVCAGCGSYSEV